MGHRCPGLDLATLMMSVFAIVLLRGYTWDLPQQNFDLDWSKTPPEMKDGLRARVHREGVGPMTKGERERILGYGRDGV